MYQLPHELPPNFRNLKVICRGDWVAYGVPQGPCLMAVLCGAKLGGWSDCHPVSPLSSRLIGITVGETAVGLYWEQTRMCRAYFTPKPRQQCTLGQHWDNVKMPVPTLSQCWATHFAIWEDIFNKKKASYKEVACTCHLSKIHTNLKSYLWGGNEDKLAEHIEGKKI